MEHAIPSPPLPSNPGHVRVMGSAARSSRGPTWGARAASRARWARGRVADLFKAFGTNGLVGERGAGIRRPAPLLHRCHAAHRIPSSPQAALIAIMAQLGSYVPAASARLRAFDGVFTRMVRRSRLAVQLHHASRHLCSRTCGWAAQCHCIGSPGIHTMEPAALSCPRVQGASDNVALGRSTFAEELG